jgi:pimeloyl-ACP methyl ester carboxylesterase
MITSDAPPRGRLYDIGGGRRLMLHRLGEGTPSVVIEAGGGWCSLGWLPIQEQLAALTTCVVYDRAGLGWSDPDPEPRTMDRTVEDLHRLLEVAEIPAPYILIGHSLGGLYVRRYAQRYPDETAGLVLVDSSHEDQWDVGPNEAREFSRKMRERFEREALTDEMTAQMKASSEKTFAAWPDDVRDPLVARVTSPEFLETAMAEIRDWDHFAAIKTAPMPPIPVIVLTGSRFDAVPGLSDEVLRSMNETKLSLHADLAGLSPKGEQRILEDAGHMINLDRPDAIVQAVQDIIAAMRS